MPDTTIAAVAAPAPARPRTDGTNDADIGIHLSPQRYLAERVEDQLRWYGDRSASAKRWYHRLQFATVVLAACVPVLALSSEDVRVRIAVAIVGALTGLAAGLLALYRFGDHWIDYRSTAEAIKHEKYRFLTRVEPYAGAKAFSLFVNRVESIILHENRAWREKALDAGFDDDPAGHGDANEPFERRTDGEKR